MDQSFDKEINVIKLLIKLKNNEVFLFDINHDHYVIPNETNEISEEIINNCLFKLEYNINENEYQYPKGTGSIKILYNSRCTNSQKTQI